MIYPVGLMPNTWRPIEEHNPCQDRPNTDLTNPKKWNQQNWVQRTGPITPRGRIGRASQSALPSHLANLTLPPRPASPYSLADLITPHWIILCLASTPRMIALNSWNLVSALVSPEILLWNPKLHNINTEPNTFKRVHYFSLHKQSFSTLSPTDNWFEYRRGLSKKDSKTLSNYFLWF